MIERYLAANPTQVEILAIQLPVNRRREVRAFLHSWTEHWEVSMQRGGAEGAEDAEVPNL